MKLIPSYARIAALSCLLGAVGAAQAQPQQLLPETVVTASRLEQRVRDALPASTVITREDIERAQIGDLPTLLARVTGVQFSQTGGEGGVSSMFTRGAESRHTLVLIDGVPVNNLNFGLPAIEHLSVANVDRIEVVRGNVSALYGSAALGGVVQIFTRAATATPQASVTAQAGSRDARRLSASGAVRLDSGTSLSIGAEKSRGQRYNYTKQAALPATNPDVDGYDREAFSASAVQEIGGGHTLGLRLRNSEGRLRYDSQFGPATQADVSAYRESGASLDGKFRLTEQLSATAQLSTATDQLDASVTAFPYDVTSRSRGANLGLEWQFAPGQRLSAGYESTRQAIRSNTNYASTRRSLDSARLGWQGDFECHQLQLNARQDEYSDYGSPTTWYAGYAFRVTDAWRISASRSSGFSAPTFNDLYAPFGGNPNLRPERLRSTEVGVQYARGGHELRATAFDNRYVDLIGNDAFFNRANIARATNEGVELAYTGRFGRSAARAGLTVQDPVNAVTGRRLERRAAVLANLGASHDVGPWSFGADLRFTGRRPDGTRTLGGYARLDATLAYAVNRQFQLLGRIDNLADKDETTAYGYRLPGRAVFVGLKWSL